MKLIELVRKIREVDKSNLGPAKHVLSEEEAVDLFVTEVIDFIEGGLRDGREGRSEEKKE